MLILELATQAIKGFSSQARAVLKPGYNVLVPPAGTPPGVGVLLSSLLYNDGRGSDAMLGTGQAPARAGLTVQGRDGKAYRLVRILGGSGALHRLEPNNTWAVVSQDPLAINNLLRDALGLPSKSQLEELFCLSAQQLPSRRPAEPKSSSSSGKPLGPASEPATKLRPNALIEAAMAASKKKFDPAQAQQDVERLRAEVQTGKALEESQFRLEGMQQRIFELEERLKQLDRLVEEVDRAKQSMRSGHSLDALGLPPDAFERAARYDDAAKKRDESIQKLREDEMAGRAEAESAHVEPIWLSRGFQIGMGAGLLALILGIVFRDTAGSYLALLDIPAFGYAGLCALRWIGDLQYRDSLSRKLSMNKDREQKLNLAFDNEFFPIKAAMRIVGVETGKEFLEFFGKRQAAEETLAAAEAKLGMARSDPQLLGALDEQDALVAQAKVLEEQIAAMGAGVMRDWRDAEAELQEIEAQLAGGAAPADKPAALGGSFEAPADKPAKDDPVPKLLGCAQELFAGASLEALGGTVRDRASQYLVALTDRRYLGVELDSAANASLVAPGRKVPAGQLDDRDLDLLYLSVKLTLVEKLAPLSQVSFVLDEPFMGWDEPKLQLVSRMLKHIGTMTQVVHASALPAHRNLADNPAQI